MQLNKVLQGITKTKLNINILGITLNSNLVQNGYIFIALKGGKTHGNNFIDDAINKGCKLVITDKEPNKEFNIPIIINPKIKDKLEILATNLYPMAKQKKIIAITGTNGKSSILSFISQTLNKLKKTTLNIGTLTHSLTTPDIFSLYRELNNFNGDYVILEVSSHALSQGRVKGLSFILAIWSNLSQDHLDYHGTMESYLNAKLMICKQAKYGIFNQDSEYYSDFSSKLKHLTYKLKDISFTIKEFGFLINLDNIIFELNLLGKFNLYNILASYKALIYLGFDKVEVIKNLSQIQSPKGRLERVLQHNIFIDFAHTPEGLKSVLIALKSHLEKDITLVFGCGGDRDKQKRSLMGRVANDYASRIILTNDNPRSENPEDIAKDIILGINKDVEVILDRELAIIAALEDKEQNIVLIAGKGHEDYQIVGTEKTSFNDYDIVIKNLT